MAFSIGWFPITFATDCRFRLWHKRGRRGWRKEKEHFKKKITFLLLNSLGFQDVVLCVFLAYLN